VNPSPPDRGSDPDQGRGPGVYRSLPRGVWALGGVSMLMDVHSLLPVFMVTTLGASVAAVGVIEGVAEATASVMKVVSGAVSDYVRKRKILMVCGYGLSAVSKPFFPLATTIWWVFTARCVDRVGKGIRGAPRDALIADIVPGPLRGAAYGLRQALDSAGAFAGPVLAVLLMLWLAGDIATVMWAAVVPAFLAVVLLVAAVKEPEHTAAGTGRARTLTLAHAKHLPARYWLVVALGTVFTLARFSEAFLILRARDTGLALAYVPAVMIVMNAVYAGLAYPAGAASDRMPARTLLVLGLAVLVAADVVLAIASTPLAAFLGAALWGTHMAVTQGLLSKLVADTAPADLRGTAFGVFNLAGGVALLLASVIAGSLWSSFGAPATFGAGACFAAVAAIGLILYRPGPGN
jgi:MFS family permease